PISAAFFISSRFNHATTPLNGQSVEGHFEFFEEFRSSDESLKINVNHFCASGSNWLVIFSMEGCQTISYIQSVHSSNEWLITIDHQKSICQVSKAMFGAPTL